MTGPWKKKKWWDCRNVSVTHSAEIKETQKFRKNLKALLAESMVTAFPCGRRARPKRSLLKGWVPVHLTRSKVLVSKAWKAFASKTTKCSPPGAKATAEGWWKRIFGAKSWKVFSGSSIFKKRTLCWRKSVYTKVVLLTMAAEIGTMPWPGLRASSRSQELDSVAEYFSGKPAQIKGQACSDWTNDSCSKLN